MFSRASALSGYLAGAALLLAALAVTTDVILRWAIDRPIKGLFELSELGFAAIIALGFAYANDTRRHVALELIGSLTGRKRGLHVVASLLSAVTFALFTYFLWHHAGAKTSYGETTLVLGLPIGPFWYAASGLMALSFLAQIPAVLLDLREIAGNAPREIASELAAPLLLLAGFALAIGALFLLPSGATALTKVGLGFAALYLLALAHVPLGVALAIAGLLGSYALLGQTPAQLIGINSLTGSLASPDLAALPLFLLMGNLAIAAGFADDIFQAASALFGRLRGGHALATIIGCAGFGAISGSSVATTATIGGVAYREMKTRNYAPGLATGSIAAGGTLGALVPPSVILIIYCVIAEQSISEAFAAALVPALLAIALYAVTVLVLAHLSPRMAPAPGPEQRFRPIFALRAAWRPAALFLSVLGGLYGGLFTVQEAAAVGTGFAFVFWLASGRASIAGLLDAIREAVASSAVFYLILIGAGIFGSFLNLAGVTNAVLSVINPETMPAWLVLALLAIMYLILGSVFDTVAALVVTVPFVIPIILALDYDLVWWGIVTLSLVEIGMITPPIGMNVFVLKGMLGGQVSIASIFRGVIPFLAADLVRLVILIAFPGLTLWLPSAW
ncbi:TRAP transporter large permease [Sinisalibacter aestuarii]|uniref:TRAP transporter large permease subunit n=1 Tax=Sinisalibacter aestuarii TaxID=2949426 RepID=A0ABQ5LTF8_9RHOB|nr:TRAP transporter large permease subunit [Sinisalibacter aestuarii]GKY88276.1 hypothetical protein STA1M1_21450 [Sinisalibacter aestuarii]